MQLWFYRGLGFTEFFTELASVKREIVLQGQTQVHLSIGLVSTSEMVRLFPEQELTSDLKLFGKFIY